MGPVYRIAIADCERQESSVVRGWLVRAGHQVVRETQSAEELVKHCKSDSPDIFLVNIESSGKGQLEAFKTIVQQRELPVIVMSGNCNYEFATQANACSVLAYLTKPIREQELLAAVSVAVQRFQELHSLRGELVNMRQALEDRKIIERAKGIVMNKRALNEADAFKCLQELARSHRQKLIDVAKSIVLAETALDPRSKLVPT